MAGENRNISAEISFTDIMIFRRRWWQHLIFWALVFTVLINIFKTSSAIEKIDLIYTGIFLLPLAGTSYVNLYYLIPRFLRKESYLLYGLFFLVLLAGGALILYILFDRWIDLILPHYYFISYYSLGQLMIYSASILVLTTLLKLSRSWFKLLRMERITTSQQLKSLQSQINPHFLLNSLQTIYALSLEKSDQTPEVILKLSEILKYTLYETEHAKINLAQELRLLEDYVEMYRYRVDPDRVEILLRMEGETENLCIAPMLLIPFVENSFKHGLQNNSGTAFIHLEINITEGELQFELRNSMGISDPGDLEKRKGIGIDNTKKRLELLYPGKHKLRIQKNQDLFVVTLNLNLNP